jgi:hypothetical protein
MDTNYNLPPHDTMTISSLLTRISLADISGCLIRHGSNGLIGLCNALGYGINKKIDLKGLT